MSAPKNAPAVVPAQFQLDLYTCPDPKDPFWVYTIQSLNQFAQQTSAYLTQQQNQQQPPTQYKQLKFATGPAVSDSFPINFPWPTAPNEMRVAQVIQGGQYPSMPVTLQWSYSSGRGTNTLNVLTITGLVPNTTYIINLALS